MSKYAKVRSFSSNPFTYNRLSRVAAHDINLLLLLISYATGRIYIIEDYV